MSWTETYTEKIARLLGEIGCNVCLEKIGDDQKLVLSTDSNLLVFSTAYLGIKQPKREEYTVGHWVLHSDPEIWQSQTTLSILFLNNMTAILAKNTAGTNSYQLDGFSSRSLSDGGVLKFIESREVLNFYISKLYIERKHGQNIFGHCTFKNKLLN